MPKNAYEITQENVGNCYNNGICFRGGQRWACTGKIPLSELFSRSDDVTLGEKSRKRVIWGQRNQTNPQQILPQN